MTASTTEREWTLSVYIVRVVVVFLYLLRQCMIRGVPITMATIVHYVHYNRLRVPFREEGCHS